MADTRISNTLINDTSEGILTYSSQIKDTNSNEFLSEKAPYYLGAFTGMSAIDAVAKKVGIADDPTKAIIYGIVQRYDTSGTSLIPNKSYTIIQNVSLSDNYTMQYKIHNGVISRRRISLDSTDTADTYKANSWVSIGAEGVKVFSQGPSELTLKLIDNSNNEVGNSFSLPIASSTYAGLMDAYTVKNIDSLITEVSEIKKNTGGSGSINFVHITSSMYAEQLPIITTKYIIEPNCTVYFYFDALYTRQTSDYFSTSNDVGSFSLYVYNGRVVATVYPLNSDFMSDSSNIAYVEIEPIDTLIR